VRWLQGRATVGSVSDLRLAQFGIGQRMLSFGIEPTMTILHRFAEAMLRKPQSADISDPPQRNSRNTDPRGAPIYQTIQFFGIFA
jgi:hypothetical protein